MLAVPMCSNRPATRRGVCKGDFEQCCWARAIFRAKRLPDLGKSLAIGMKELRKEAANLGDEDKAEQRPRNTDGKEIAPSAGKGAQDLRAL